MCVAPCRRLGSECSSWYFLHPVREPAAIGHHLVVGVCHGYRGALLIQCGLAPQGQRHRSNLRSESKPPGRLSGYRRLCPKRDVLPSWTRFQATRPPACRRFSSRGWRGPHGPHGRARASSRPTPGRWWVRGCPSSARVSVSSECSVGSRSRYLSRCAVGGRAVCSRVIMAKQSQATWGGRFSAAPAELMLTFSESVSFDARLAPFDIAGSKGHSAMLAHVGILTAKERDEIHAGLDAIGAEIAAGRFKWNRQLEDVHMNIEQALTKRVPAAAKLHTARSRNDQVATDMRLFFKHACADLDVRLAGAQRAILQVAERDGDVLIPGYTHLQRAQPVALAHH